MLTSFLFRVSQVEDEEAADAATGGSNWEQLDPDNPDQDGDEQNLDWVPRDIGPIPRNRASGCRCGCRMLGSDERFGADRPIGWRMRIWTRLRKLAAGKTHLSIFPLALLSLICRWLSCLWTLTCGLFGLGIGFRSTSSKTRSLHPLLSRVQKFSRLLHLLKRMILPRKKKAPGKSGSEKGWRWECKRASARRWGVEKDRGREKRGKWRKTPTSGSSFPSLHRIRYMSGTYVSGTNTPNAAARYPENGDGMGMYMVNETHGVPIMPREEGFGNPGYLSAYIFA